MQNRPKWAENRFFRFFSFAYFVLPAPVPQLGGAMGDPGGTIQAARRRLSGARSRATRRSSPWPSRGRAPRPVVAPQRAAPRPRTWPSSWPRPSPRPSLVEGTAVAPARARPRTRRQRRPPRSPARAARRQRHAPAAVACLTCRARRGRGRAPSAAGTPPPARRGPETQRGPHATQSVRPRGRRAVSCAPPWRRRRAYPLAPSLVCAAARRGASIVPMRSPVAASTTSSR